MSRIGIVLDHYHHPAFPVVDRHGEVKGLLKRYDLEQFLKEI